LGQKSAEAIVVGEWGRGEKLDEGPNGKGVEKKGVGSGEDSRDLSGTGQAWTYH
jgi:hypothetical protein